MKKYINFKTNYFFPTPTRYLGYVIAIIGIIGVFTSGIETLIFSIVGIGLSYTRLGVQIDIENQKLKEYTNIFGLKNGNWKSLSFYPYLTVLEISERSSTYSQTNRKLSSIEKVYRITLLNDNHYEKILLKQLRNKEIAHQEAEIIAKNINVEKVLYSPS